MQSHIHQNISHMPLCHIQQAEKGVIENIMVIVEHTVKNDR